VEEEEDLVAEGAAEEEVGYSYSMTVFRNTISLGRGGSAGGQRTGAIQEFSGSKMTFDDSD